MKKRWFTLVEMLIVIVIIWILAAALLPQIWSARDKANDTAREANVRTLVTAMVQYWMDHTDWYPTSNMVGTAFNTNLTKYGVSSGNFNNQPNGSTYAYTKLKGDHFIIRVNLSCESDSAPTCWNCSSGQIATYTGGNTDRTAVTFTGAGTGLSKLDSFCQLQ